MMTIDDIAWWYNDFLCDGDYNDDDLEYKVSAENCK